MGILDGFILPGNAAADIAQKMRAVDMGDGVSMMSGHDGAMSYRFFVHPEYNSVKSEELGYEVFDEIEMIEWLADRGTKPTEQVRFLPPALLSFNREGQAVRGKYLDSYLRFKEGKNAPGMPLNKWGVLSDGEVATLGAAGIFSVEQYAAMPKDRIAGRYPDNFVDAHSRAVQYVNGKLVREANQETATKLEALEGANSELLAKYNELMEKFVQMQTVKTEEPKAKKGK